MKVKISGTLLFLFLTLMFILAFQNCIRNRPIIITSTGGDNAVFRLSEKYGGEVVSNISWQIKSGNSCGMRTKAVETGLSIEIPWNQNYDKQMPWGSFSIAALIHLEQEGWMLYLS